MSTAEDPVAERFTPERFTPERHLTEHIDELVVPFDDSQLRRRVQRRRRGMWGRVVSLGITLVVLVLLYRYGGTQLQGRGLRTVYGVVLGISLGWLVGYLVAWLRARRALRRVGRGTAVRIGRPGVQVGQTFTPWSDVSRLAMVRGRRFRGGQGARLQVQRTAGPPVDVPLDQFEVPPATLDSTARAYSGGRHGVDLEALDV